MEELPAIEPAPPIAPPARSGLFHGRFASLETRLFLLALLVFALTRFIGLDRWPIYFFTDEAIQSVQAASLLHNGFRDINGELLPTFFQNGNYFNLSVSVYAQVLPYALFGFSVLVTRGVSVLVALSGAAAIGLMLRDIFKVKFWWIGTLILSTAPAFFLHSRTAFETVFGTSLYAWFLYFYLRYRLIRPRNLYAALLFGALAFYSYSPQQAIVVLTGLMLLIVDARYHWQHRKTAAPGALLLVVLALPFMRFQATNPDEAWLHLRLLDSYMSDPALTTQQKITQFIQTYTQAISPGYWFSTDHSPDLIRHVMKNYGNLLTFTLPLFLLGLLVSLRRFKSPAVWTMLIALLVTPIGGALAQIQIYRMLSFVVPASIFIALGLILLLDWLTKRVAYRRIALSAFVLLAAVNSYMLVDVLTNGPTWYGDYDIGGLQYGGEQVFAAARDIVNREPDTRVLVSPTWANGTDVLARFFVPDELRIDMGNIDAFMYKQLPLDDHMLLVMTPSEYERTVGDPKFTDIRVEQTLKYPDGREGFYFVRLRYSPNAPAIFAAEEAERRQPVREDFTLDGQPVSILHSKFDIGTLTDLFDNDSFTLVRGTVDNPLVIEVTWPQPRPLTGVTLTTGTFDFTATITLTYADGETQTYSHDYINTGADPANDFPFEPAPTRPVKTLHIEIKDLNASGDAHIHVRDIRFR